MKQTGGSGFSYLHSTVVLLKDGGPGPKRPMELHLHSTVVLLKVKEHPHLKHYQADLHSTVVLLKEYVIFVKQVTKKFIYILL